MRQDSDSAALLAPPRRRGPGKPWPKGVSGNPGGVPKDIPAAVIEARRLALSWAPKAIERLGELLEDEDPRVVAVAATALLDRGGVRPHAADERPEAAAPVVDVEALRAHLAARVAALAPASPDAPGGPQERAALSGGAEQPPASENAATGALARGRGLP